MASTDNGRVPAVSAPWTLTGTVYIFMMYSSSKDATRLSSHPDLLFSSLEAESDFSNDPPVGGLSMIQLIRYIETPVGPYDEMVIIPGYFEHEMEGKTKRNLRCTRVFVSQENTCWNGRKNWNIPKHLASFDFMELSTGHTQIDVYPLLPDASGRESVKSKAPFFTTRFKPIPYLPSFPASTDWAKYIRWDLGLVQPPLPEGTETLPGTKEWCKIAAVEWSKKTCVGWFDPKQENNEPSERDALLGGDQDDVNPDGLCPNFWPGLGRWRIGIKMEEATVEFPEGEHWTM